MSNQETSRLEMELALLEAMYPAQLHYDAPSRQVNFVCEGGGSALHLRLPERYPSAGTPDVISATDAAKTDLRAQTSHAVQKLGLTEGEEALDAVLAAFQQLLATRRDGVQSLLGENTTDEITRGDANQNQNQSNVNKKTTVIIWLHHLLNTNKRKLALSPPPSSPPVSGIAKPGYPGILIYAGPAAAVSEHVAVLKAQNWQAFQVRYEEEALWTLAHGEGVREVESMSDVVKAVQGTAGQKAEFLKAVGIK